VLLDAVVKGLKRLPETRLHSKDWLRSPRSLSGKLRRVAPFLRKIGIEVKFGDREGKARNRIIRITAPNGSGTEPSSPSSIVRARQQFVLLRGNQQCGRWLNAADDTTKQ
jgi:hypothetical protein